MAGIVVAGHIGVEVQQWRVSVGDEGEVGAAYSVYMETGVAFQQTSPGNHPNPKYSAIRFYQHEYIADSHWF